ncbi:MAG: protoporphyrinogen oxidase [Microcoleaceae cyanobacterium]
MEYLSNPMIDTLVVGAGISGLSCAYQLSQTADRPLSLLVAEAQDRVGGNITTQSINGFIWEEGPTSFSQTPELLQLIGDGGLESELVLADRKLPRYVYWDQQLIAVPMSLPALVTSPLISLRGKVRALLGGIGFVPPNVTGQAETVSAFFQRHLGTEVLQRLVEPFISGIYAGDPHRLENQAAFSRVAQMAELGGGLIPGAVLSRLQNPKPKPDPHLPKTRPGELGSFRRGLEMLPQAIAEHLQKQSQDQVRLNWKLTQLNRTEHQTYQAEFQTPTGPQQIEARTVLLTTPAYVSGSLLQPLNLQISQALEAIPYPMVACVVLAYPNPALKQPLVGFGNLIPRGQGIQTLGTIWSSSLFPGRAPEEWQMLTNFIGGATAPEVASWSEEQIVEQVHQDLCQTLLNGTQKPKVLAVHRWPRAIPQYNLGHLNLLAQIHQELEQLPGLFLCSNYTDGVALGDCVKRGMNQAVEIQSYLASSS